MLKRINVDLDINTCKHVSRYIFIDKDQIAFSLLKLQHGKRQRGKQICILHNMKSALKKKLL